MLHKEGIGCKFDETSKKTYKQSLTGEPSDDQTLSSESGDDWASDFELSTSSEDVSMDEEPQSDLLMEPEDRVTDEGEHDYIIIEIPQ